MFAADSMYRDQRNNALISRQENLSALRTHKQARVALITSCHSKSVQNRFDKLMFTSDKQCDTSRYSLLATAAATAAAVAAAAY